MTLVAGGSGDIGVSRLPGEILDVVTRLPAAVEALTGVSVTQVWGVTSGSLGGFGDSRVPSSLVPALSSAGCPEEVRLRGLRRCHRVPKVPPPPGASTSSPVSPSVTQVPPRPHGATTPWCCRGPQSATNPSPSATSCPPRPFGGSPGWGTRPNMCPHVCPNVIKSCRICSLWLFWGALGSFWGFGGDLRTPKGTRVAPKGTGRALGGATLKGMWWGQGT